MNDTLKTIAERFSCRDFADTPLTDEQVNALAEAALAAPSGVNRQPWHVIIVTDKALIDELDVEGMRILAEAEDQSTYERMMSRGGKLFYNAPCMFMIAADTGAAMDCGILSQNLALAAHSLGLGSVICGMAGTPINGPKGESYKARLQFPEGYGFGIGVLIGTPKSIQKPHELDRKKLTYIR
ncbi:MAG: nitroreductase family protein [Clostridiales bacterium]|nr:nitroreductase family protein [Clostridiales bacterium]